MPIKSFLEYGVLLYLGKGSKSLKDSFVCIEGTTTLNTSSGAETTTTLPKTYTQGGLPIVAHYTWKPPHIEGMPQEPGDFLISQLEASRLCVSGFKPLPGQTFYILGQMQNGAPLKSKDGTPLGDGDGTYYEGLIQVTF